MQQGSFCGFMGVSTPPGLKRGLPWIGILKTSLLSEFYAKRCFPYLRPDDGVLPLLRGFGYRRSLIQSGFTRYTN
jgi:hypothetical protein